MAGAGASDDDDSDVILLVHQLPVDMDGPDEGRLAHLLPPLHRSPSPSPPPPFRLPPPPQAVASAEHRLSFRGWLGAPRHWDLWVSKLRSIHGPLWRRLGIHDAVLASTYRIKPDPALVLHLASFWSPATSTFAFPWGEATVTLHDVAHIAGLPATGSPVPAPLPPEWRPEEAGLNGVRLGFNRSACKKAHLSAWIKHFLTDQNDVVLEHAAFLALWLTRFVLPGHPESTMRQAIFPIAVRLAQGERIALAPAVLASLYRDLRDIKAFLVAAGAAVTTGNADVLSSLSLYSPLYLLHIWIWERFPALRPGRENPLGIGEPMAARWHDLSRKVNPTLIREVFSSRDNFLWQLPYATSLKKYSGWVCSSDLTKNNELRLLAHCLRPCELVGMDCIEQYLPHRVARQFGLDQDVPMDVRRANQDWLVAWQTYELDGKNVSLFIPQSEPGITSRYAQWWRQRLQSSDLHARAPSIPVESKPSKRKVKKTPAAMEAEAEKERRVKKARVSPSDKKRRLEELYDPKLSCWPSAGRNGFSEAAGSCCKGGSLPKYEIGSDDALLPNIGATNDDVVLLVPRMQTTTPAVVVPKKDDTMNLAIGDSVVMPMEIPNNELEVGATAMHEEKLHNPIDRSLDITNKSDDTLLPNIGASNDDVVLLVPRMQTATPAVVVPKKDDTMNLVIGDGVVMPMEISNNELEVGATAMREEKLNNTVDMSLDIKNKSEEDTAVMKLNEAMGISVARSLDITDRPEEGATVVMELEKEAMETHNITEDDTTKVPQSEYEKLRDAAPIEEDNKEKPCAVGKDLAAKDVDESTEADRVKKVEGEGCDCDLLMAKDGDKITDALGVEQPAEGQAIASALEEKGIHNHVEEITLVEPVDGQIERSTSIGTKDIPEEITQAHEKEPDNAMMKDSKNSTDGEMPCTSDTIQLNGGMMEKQCIQNDELNYQREPSSDVAAMKVEGVYEEITMDTHEEVALATKQDHKIIGENRALTILEGSHILDSGVKSDLITLEVDEIHTAGGIQNQEISDLDKDVALKHTLENKETIVSEGSHMLDSTVKSDLVTLDTDETHAGGGIRNREDFGLDKELSLKQKQDHIMICENKETVVSGGSHMLDSVVNSDLVILETNETHGGGGIQNQEILGLDKGVQEMTVKQKQDHTIICENMETAEPQGIHMLHSRGKAELITLEIDKTAAEGNENQDILDFNKQQGINELQDPETAIENNKMNMEGEDVPTCSGYHQIGTAIEKSEMNMSEDAGIPDCSEHRIDPTGMEVNEVESTKRLQNQVFLDNKEQLAMEERHHVGTPIENNKINLPNEDVLVCGEYQINSTGAEVIEVKSTNDIQNQELLDNKDDKVMEKRMECENAHGSGISLEEDYKLGGGLDTCAVAVNASDSMQSKETCTIEEATEDKQRHEVEHVKEERILEDTIMIDSGELKSDATDVEVDMARSNEGTLNQYALSVVTEVAVQGKQYQEMAGEDTNRDVADMDALECRVKPDGAVNMSLCVEMEAAVEEKQDQEMADEDTNRHVADMNALECRVKPDGAVNMSLSVETEAIVQEKQDHEMVGEDTNRDVADENALECRVKPDGAVNMSHEALLTTQSVDITGFNIPSENKEKIAPFEEHNITEVAGFESNQTTALPLEPENLVKVKQESLGNETERSILRESDKASCKDQTSACVTVSPSNMDDQCEDENGWAEESTKIYDNLASDSINPACRHPVKFGQSSNEEVKRAQNIKSMYLKDIKESLGRIRAEPVNRVQTTSRHTVQESHSTCREIKVPLRDSGRDFGRDRSLELVVTSPAEETSRWRQEQYALQILEDVHNARIAEKTRMEMEIRILKAQIASMEKQVMNLDHFSEVKSRSKRH